MDSNENSEVVNSIETPLLESQGIQVGAEIDVENVPETMPSDLTAIQDHAESVCSVVDGDSDPAEILANGFVDLGLSATIAQTVTDLGYQDPTAIQAEIIPLMLAGRDILAQSQTGTGKTAAFALPILSQIDVNSRQTQVLVLTPTRELAIQVARSFKSYASGLKRFEVLSIYGGQDYSIQLKALKKGVHVVVGTPGRVIDHIDRGTLDLSLIQTLVLDEADEMLNMGFLEDVEKVLSHAPKNRRIALFSATLPEPIRQIAKNYLNDPAKITIRKQTMTADLIRQRALFVEPRQRVNALMRILETEDRDGTIVFTKTREASVKVAEALTREGFAAVALNGDVAQKVRERTIEQLKGGSLDILVATDVAARGLDVSRISHVINFDLPEDPESYIHRVGRTGRAGRSGEAILMLSKKEMRKLKLIEKATRKSIEFMDFPSLEAVNAKRSQKWEKQVVDAIAGGQLEAFQKLVENFCTQTDHSPMVVAAALAKIGQGNRELFLSKSSRSESTEWQPAESRGGRPSRFSSDGDDFDSRGQRGKRDRGKSKTQDFRRLGPPDSGMERFRIDVGRNDGVKPGNIVGAIANEAGIDGGSIGPIKIHDAFSTIDLPKGMPADICDLLQNTWVAGKRLRIRLWEDREESTERHQRKPYAARSKFTKKPGGGFKQRANKSKSRGPKSSIPK